MPANISSCFCSLINLQRVRHAERSAAKSKQPRLSLLLPSPANKTTLVILSEAKDLLLHLLLQLTLQPPLLFFLSFPEGIRCSTIARTSFALPDV
jgi:hypothetical protein